MATITLDHGAAAKLLRAHLELRSKLVAYDAALKRATYAEDWPAVRNLMLTFMLEITDCFKSDDAPQPGEWMALNLFGDMLIAANEGRPHPLTNHTNKKVRANRNDPTRKGLMALGAAVIHVYGACGDLKKQNVGRQVASAMTEGGFLSERGTPIGGPMMVQHAKSLSKLQPPNLSSGSEDHMKRWLILMDREYFDTHVKRLTDSQSSLPAALKFLTAECKRQLSLS